LHYREDEQWEDLTFGQDTLKLIDTLTQKLEMWQVEQSFFKYSLYHTLTNLSMQQLSGAIPNPSVTKIQKKLQTFNERFAVRLALTTLHEADWCSPF